MKRQVVTGFLMILLAVTPAAMAFADQERGSREEELYEDANEALDDAEWREAADGFRKVAAMNGERAAAALHWLAYAQHKMGQRSDALATLVDLQRRYPKSKWAADGKALELEVRQSAGQAVAPDRVDDEDLKLMAVNGLMHTDPERAIPILEKIINGNQSAKVKDKALFVLAQANTPRALEIMGRIARDSSRPELQARALKNLGILGGENSRKVLGDVYASTNDRKVKKTILKSYMISGDRARLLSLAKGESDPELRADAVQQLGITGAREELADLYATEQSVDVKKKIIHAMFLGGNSDKLADLARGEKNVELRLAAIKNLGLLGGERSGQFLVSMYESDTNPDVRKAVINGLFLQGNARALVSLARKENNRDLKKQIVSKLALINSKESADYLLEILND
ncbi:MAG TPA: HEAT repeat domain-containing protein [Thermoanaerobaculia bacterium]|nr:HEAT repeat domain-containing protein [Thermoanaerobaculia bacterium]